MQFTEEKQKQRRNQRIQSKMLREVTRVKMKKLNPSELTRQSSLAKLQKSQQIELQLYLE